jgi:uncharacterized protein YoxC
MARLSITAVRGCVPQILVDAGGVQAAIRQDAASFRGADSGAIGDGDTPVVGQHRRLGAGPRRRRSAGYALAFTALLGVTLSACTSSGAPAAGGSPGTAPAATVQWAGSVCSSVQKLNQSVRNLTSALTTGSRNSDLSQLGQQLKSRTDAVVAAAQDVSSSVQNVPASASQAVKNAGQNLQSAANASKQSLQRLQTNMSQLGSDTTSAQFAEDFASVGGAATTAAGDVGALLRSVQGYASSGQSEMQQAFGNAPACQQLSKS